MANTIITPTVIAKEGLMQLENNLAMGKRVHRDYEKEFRKVGDTVNVRKPVRFEAKDGSTRVNQDVQEANTNIKLDSRKHVSWSFNSQDLTLSIEKFSERYIQPAAIALANKVDYDLCGLYNRVFMYTGTAGTTPSSFKNFATPGKRLTQNATPLEMRNQVLDPEADLNVRDLLRQQNNDRMVEGAVRGTSIGNVAGFEMVPDQNVRVHSSSGSTAWGTPLVNGASQNVTYANAGHTYGPTSQDLDVDGLAASGTIKEGDRFTIADVYAVNPVSRDSTGVLQEFVVLKDSTASSGAATLTIAPAIITSGPFQTVNAAPADNASITPVTSDYTANLAFHKNAFGLVTAPLIIPDGVSFSARESHDGLSMRVVKDYDIDSDDDVIRLDILYGVKALYSDLACVLMG